MSQGSEQSSTSTTSKSNGEALVMSKLIGPIERFAGKVRKQVVRNETGTLTLQVRITKGDGLGTLQEVRSKLSADEDELNYGKAKK